MLCISTTRYRIIVHTIAREANKSNVYSRLSTPSQGSSSYELHTFVQAEPMKQRVFPGTQIVLQRSAGQAIAGRLFLAHGAASVMLLREELRV